MRHPVRHFRAQFLLTLLVVGLVAVVVPRQAEAMYSLPQTTVTISDIPRQIGRAIEKGVNALKSKIKIATDIAFKNSVRAFVSRVTKEVATQLATAGPGQKPLFLQNPRTFFKNAANSAATDFIDNFSRSLTGRTGPGGAFSSSRAKYLISRSLRTALGSPLEQCRQDCRDAFSVTQSKIYEPGFIGPKQQQNDYEAAITLVISQMEAVPGGTRVLASTGDGQTIMTCQFVTTPGPPLVPNYTIATASVFIPLQLSAKNCLAAQQQAINNARAEAQKASSQCLRDCQTGLAGVTTQAIQAATAKDVFASIQNIDPADAPAYLANALSKDQSDFGQLVSASSRLLVAVNDRITGENTRLKPQVVARESKVSGETLTPPEAVTSTLTGLPLSGQSGETTYTGTGVADVLKGITAFLNSPVGKALSNYFKSKCGLNPDACKGPSNAKSTIGQLLFGSGAPTGIAGAELQFAQLGKVEFITGDPGRNEVSITDQLTSSGLIDAQFRSAIEEGQTVQQALNDGRLDPRKTFGFDVNGVQPSNGYTYRALQYLRKFRVIPVGWELAATYSQQFDKISLSLGFLTKQYPMCGNTLVCSNDQSKACTLATATTDCGAGNSCGLATGQASQSVCSNNFQQTCVADTDCDAGGTCGASPYCGLVDPNWVLKAPQTYCRRQGAGEEIISKEFVCDQNNIRSSDGTVINPAVADSGVDGNVTTTGDQDQNPPNCVDNNTTNPNPDVGHWIISRNSDTCADVQSCISENEDGTCLAYGYCVQEKDTYKFSGTKCSAENGTCTTYVDDRGQEASYLANTLDFQNCNTDNAGCQWYCRDYDAVAGRWTCAESDRNDTTGKIINLTDSAQSCTASQAGCRQFIQTGNNSNLLANSGFEEFTGGALDGPTTAVFAGWSTLNQIEAYPVTPTDLSVTANNGAAVRLISGGANGGLTQTFTGASPLYERTFVGSIRAKADAACNAKLTISTDAGATTTDMPITSNWATFSATKTIGAQGTVVSNSPAVTYTITVDGCRDRNLVVDSAQLEESGLTRYKDYGAANVIYLNGTRQQCTVEDVGCQKYRPVQSGPAVTGVVRASNRCSAENVGCGAYTLEPITAIPQRAGGPTTIVPNQAQVCSAAEVGCEEYTNLDEIAQGGEEKAYFKSVKQCVKPSNTNASNPAQQTYYTWVGDAQRGFVLRSYNLIRSNLGGPDFAPCTKLSVGGSGAASTCIDDGASVAAAQVNCASAADLAANASCAEYYDANLTVYYRLRSATVSVTDDCHPFKNTLDSEAGQDLIYNLSPKENVTCRAAAAFCRAYSGNAGKTTRKIFSDNFESGTTANWVTANTAPSSAAVSLGGHSMKISGTAFTALPILDGKLTMGKTYVVSFLAASAVDATPRPRIEAYLGSVSGNTFTYSINDTSQRFDPVGGITTSWNTNITPPGPEWNTFTLGPLTHTNGSNTSLGLIAVGGDVYVDNITLTEVNDTVYLTSKSVTQCLASEIGCAAYRDDKNQNQYLKSFTRICSEQVVGCQALIDTQNSATPFAQTVKNVTTPADSVTTVVNNPKATCPAAAKGCEALGVPVYSVDRAITSFKTVYLKNNPDRHTQDLCYANEVFCRAYSMKGGGAAFFKDPGTGTCEFRKDPGDTGGAWYITGTQIVCPSVNPPTSGRPIGASCSPVCRGGDRDGRACLSTSDCAGGGACVGDPANAGKIVSGTGTIISQCTTSAQCTSGTTTDGTITAGQNTCIYLAGLCPEGENGCTEYRDPADPVSCRAECPYVQQGASPVYVDATCAPTTCNGGSNAGQNCQSSDQCSGGSCVGAGNTSTTGFPGCRSYFYIRDTVEDTAGECNGVIDPALGCRPFNDTSKNGLNFRGL